MKLKGDCSIDESGRYTVIFEDENGEELNDAVQYDETGYKGFYLIKKLSKKVTVQVWDSELDKPNICIEQKEGKFISFPLTPELVMNWFEKK